MKRVFAAIDVSEKVRVGINAYSSALRDEFSDTAVRWERPEKLHITVKFAGSLNGWQLVHFSERAQTAAKAAEPFSLQISETGAFIKRRGPSVLWLGVEQVEDGDPLTAIATILGQDRKRFHPHVTIARIKDASKVRIRELLEKHKGAQFGPLVFGVNKLALYESSLLPTGSVYTRLASFELGSGR